MDRVAQALEELKLGPVSRLKKSELQAVVTHIDPEANVNVTVPELRTILIHIKEKDQLERLTAKFGDLTVSSSAKSKTASAKSSPKTVKSAVASAPSASGGSPVKEERKVTVKREPTEEEAPRVTETARKRDVKVEPENDEDFEKCYHGLPVKFWRVKKENANHNRLFGKCPLALGDPGRCHYFRWADERRGSDASMAPSDGTEY